jgi:hypothetical protein
MSEQRKAVIKNADMSEEMQQDAVDIASQALAKYNIEKVSCCSSYTGWDGRAPLYFIVEVYRRGMRTVECLTRMGVWMRPCYRLLWLIYSHWNAITSLTQPSSLFSIS